MDNIHQDGFGTSVIDNSAVKLVKAKERLTSFGGSAITSILNRMQRPLPPSITVARSMDRDYQESRPSFCTGRLRSKLKQG